MSVERLDTLPERFRAVSAVFSALSEVIPDRSIVGFNGPGEHFSHDIDVELHYRSLPDVFAALAALGRQGVVFRHRFNSVKAPGATVHHQWRTEYAGVRFGLLVLWRAGDPVEATA